MRLPAILRSLVLLACALPQVRGRERITVELKPEEGVTCAELAVPRAWTVPPYDPAYSYAGLAENSFEWYGAKFEFRQGAQLLISVSAPPPLNPGTPRTRLDSLDRYAVVQRKGKFVLASASEAQWQSARVLRKTQRHIDGKAENGKPLSYASRTFAPSGRYWWLSPFNSTLLSVDQANIALVSWDGTVHIPDPFGAFQSSRMDGHYFVDLYHVATGRRLALIRGKFHDVDPGFAATMGFWVEGSRFVLPVSSDMRRLVLCEVQ